MISLFEIAIQRLFLQITCLNLSEEKKSRYIIVSKVHSSLEQMLHGLHLTQFGGTFIWSRLKVHWNLFKGRSSCLKNRWDFNSNKLSWLFSFSDTEQDFEYKTGNDEPETHSLKLKIKLPGLAAPTMPHWGASPKLSKHNKSLNKSSVSYWFFTLFNSHFFWKWTNANQRFVSSIGNIEKAMWVFNSLGRLGWFGQY